MILADCDIETFQRLGMLQVYPWNPKKLQPASYDLMVDKHYRKLEDGKLREFYAVPYDLPRIQIQPDEFMLLSTIETVTLGPNVAAQVAGKSSWARKGLIVESAGFVDPGFSGTLTLEVKNIGPNPIQIKLNDTIAQIVFFQMRSKSLNPYNSERNHYQGQSGPTESWF